MDEHRSTGTAWKENAILYEYAKESKPVSSRACLLLKSPALVATFVPQMSMILTLARQIMSPIPIQAWGAKAHEEGESRVIHLDLSKDLGELQLKEHFHWLM